jgi:putative membrane protein insertion efficiency factor
MVERFLRPGEDPSTAFGGSPPQQMLGRKIMIAKLMILVAKGWQKGPSQVLPPSCRYQPSCSAYAITAIQRYGAAKGGWLALKRILRCHPWGGQGPDPVP